MTNPIIKTGYNVTFKLIDRGVLEAFGSTAISSRLLSLNNEVLRVLFETGNLYIYALFHLAFLGVLVLMLI